MRKSQMASLALIIVIGMLFMQCNSNTVVSKTIRYLSTSIYEGIPDVMTAGV